MTGGRWDLGYASLTQALSETLTVDELKQLAALIGAKSPSRKADLVELIAGHLEGERLQAAWESLDEVQQAAVAEVVHGVDSYFYADRFFAKYRRRPKWGEFSRFRSKSPPTGMRLFFYGRGFMPTDLQERLRTFVPPPPEVQVKTVAGLPETFSRPYRRYDRVRRSFVEGVEDVRLVVRASDPAALHECSSMLRLIDAGKVSVSDKTRRPTAAALRTVAPVLEGGDFYTDEEGANPSEDEGPGAIRAFAWPMLLQAGGLAQQAGTRLALTKAGGEALTAPPADTMRKLWQRWLETTFFDELARIECVKGQTGKGKRGLTAASGRRRAIAGALAACPVQQWMTFDDFFRYMVAAGWDFEVTRNAWDLYIADPHYGSLGYEGGESILAERYVLVMLFEYAATLGLVDVAYLEPAGARVNYGDLWGTDGLPYLSRYDGLKYLRINALGAYCLGVRPRYEPAREVLEPMLKVLPNLEVVAHSGTLSRSEHMTLDAHAVRVSDRVWRLERGALLDAMDDGRSLEIFRDFLLARMAGPLPATALRLLEDVEERSVRVRARGTAQLIECSDEALAIMIAGDTRLRKLCMRAGERHLVVAEGALAAFRKGLRAAGYLLATGGQDVPKRETRKAKRAQESG